MPITMRGLKELENEWFIIVIRFSVIRKGEMVSQSFSIYKEEWFIRVIKVSI